MAHAAYPGELGVHAEPQSFWRRYVFSLDHKVIAIQYLFTGLCMALVGGLLAMGMRAQLAWPHLRLLRPDQYLGFVSMHGTIMLFWVLTPLQLGVFANYLIPLMCGARDMAFPLVNMLSYWTYALSIVPLLAAFFVPGGPPNGGWVQYPPLSALRNATPGSLWGVDLWIVAIILFSISSLFGSLNYITTTLQMRTRGLSMGRLPLTIWGMFLTAVLALLVFPVLMAAGILLLFDRHLGTSFFVPAGVFVGSQPVPHSGGDPLLWQHLFWFFGHPEVYIVILPSMGIVSDVIATFARKGIFAYRGMVGAMLLISGLSFLVYGHHMFVSGMSPQLGTAFALTTLAIGIPSAVKTFNWVVTLWGARIHATTAMLFAVGFVSVFVAGGLSGPFLGANSVDIPLHDTYFVVAHFHLVMAVASLFGIFAAIYYWFPKMFGRMLDERLGKVHFWLSVIGAYGAFFPMHILGIAGMHRRIYSIEMYPYLHRLAGINVFITLFAFLIFLGGLVFAWNILRTLRQPATVTDPNPWRACTLEWSTRNRPGHGNWEGPVPAVYRGPYEFNLPDVEADYVPQWVPAPTPARA